MKESVRLNLDKEQIGKHGTVSTQQLSNFDEGMLDKEFQLGLDEITNNIQDPNNKGGTRTLNIVFQFTPDEDDQTLIKTKYTVTTKLQNPKPIKTQMMIASLSQDAFGMVETSMRNSFANRLGLTIKTEEHSE